MNQNTDELIELGQDARKRHDHTVDSINLLIFTFLLILVILTVWLFKYKKFAYIHETGLAIIYGTIFGIIIRYGFKHTNLRSLNVSMNLSIQTLPEQIYLNVPNREESFVYRYLYPRVLNDSHSQDYEDKARFDPEIFFNILLPPVIFNAGYSMKRRHFFKNFGAILTFAFIGTVISCFFIGGFMYCVISVFRSIKSYFSFTDCLFFGAIISATDPVTVLAIFNDQKVNVNLNAIIFGESVLNDAVSIILAQAIEKYSGLSNSNKFDMKQFFQCIYNFFAVFFGAFVMGSSMGCFTALLTKYTYIRQHASLETALFILMSYSTFLAAEATGLTGIVSVLFCGIFNAHYTFNNLSRESQTQTKEIFNLLNFLSENFIFIYIGITLFTFGSHQWEFSYIFFALVAIVLARAVNVYPLAFLVNLSRSRGNKIDLNMQHLLFFSGLRGAMAFALAMRNTSTQARQLILTTTSIIVVVTVIVCGGLTNKMLYWLKIKNSSEDETETYNINEMNIISNNNSNGMFELDGYHSDVPETETINSNSNFSKMKRIIKKFSLFRLWHSFDVNFMKPLLTNTTPTLMDTMPKFCLPLSRLLTTPEQSGLKSISNSQYSLVEPIVVKNPSRQTLTSLDNVQPINEANGELQMQRINQDNLDI